MRIWSHISKSSIVLPSLFFAGIAATSYVIRSIAESLSDSQLYLIGTTLSLTLLAGAAAINYLAGRKEVKIVYREKQLEARKASDTEHASEVNLLDVETIDQLTQSGNHPPVQNALNAICNKLQAGQGAVYVLQNRTLELKYGYALAHDRQSSITFEIGEGLVGRVAAQNEELYIDQLPEGYITVYSGLGSASPTYLAIVPMTKEGVVKGVLEIASFHPINRATLNGLKTVGSMLAEVLNNENLMEYAA